MSGRTFEGVFKGKQHRLIKKIDIEHGLLRKLEEGEVITTTHRRAIEEAPKVERGGKLLDILLKRDDDLVPTLCEALIATDQPHVARMLGYKAAAEMTCDMSSETLNLTVPHHLAAQSASEEERRGSQGTDPDWQTVEKRHGDNRPLNDDQRRVVDVNRCQLVLVMMIDPNIIDQLYDNKCFNVKHKDYIESGETNIDKVDKLLDIIRCGSVADLNKLVVALDRNGQTPLAELLSKGGVIVDVTACIGGIGKEEESCLIAALKRTLSATVKGTASLLGKLYNCGIKLLAVGPRNSLAVLFVCESRTGLKNLGNSYVSGELQSILEAFFTSLLVTDYPQATVHIKKLVWELSDYCRCSLYFNQVPQSAHSQPPVPANQAATAAVDSADFVPAVASEVTAEVVHPSSSTISLATIESEFLESMKMKPESTIKMLKNLLEHLNIKLPESDVIKLQRYQYTKVESVTSEVKQTLHVTSSHDEEDTETEQQCLQISGYDDDDDDDQGAAAAAAPVSRETSHPPGVADASTAASHEAERMSELVELRVIQELTRANEIVDQLKRTSPDVICVIHRLRQNITAYERAIIQDDLREKIKAALYQGGIETVMASAFAYMMAYNIVKDIEIVLVETDELA